MDNRLTPDLDQARKFLEVLDPECSQHTFQTFDDSKHDPNRQLTRILNGSFEDCKNELTRLNQLGAGVYVTVNRTDGFGRKKENIELIRAVFQEDDTGHNLDWPLDPGIVVESSPGRYHRYFLTNCPDTREFSKVQKRLVEDYNSDPNAKDISRVLRLPGFYHQKNEPKLVEIKSIVGTRHSWDEIKAAFPPVIDPEPRRNSLSTVPPSVDISEVKRALNFINPDKDYYTWIQTGMALHSTNHPEAFSLWDRWSALGIKYNPEEMASKWNSFKGGDFDE